MGCGKSSVGRRLSELLCCHFMDLDDVIVEREGRSIPEIFATDGEGAFRQKELEVLQDIVHAVDAGGGGSKTESLPLRGPLPFTRPRAAMVFDSPSAGSKCIENKNIRERHLVIALGGGTVLTPECAELVQNNTCCIYLKASVDTLMNHLAGEAAGRPMLTDADLRTRIETLMQQRSSTYEKTAHITIDTDGKPVEAVASEIASGLN